MGSWTRGLASFGVALGTIAGAHALTGTAPAHAAPGLETTATTTYTVDLAAGLVRGRVEFGFVNSIPDQQVGDRIESTYFATFPFALPGDATGIGAVAGDRPLPVTVTPSDDFQLVTVEFGTNLEYEERLDMVVTFELPGYAPRAPEPWRANEAFVAFVAWAYGDPGAATVRIITPTGADVAMPDLDDGSYPRPEVVVDGNTTVHTFPGIAGPDEFGLFVTATDNHRLVERRLKVRDQNVVVQAWPDDARWGAFIARQVRAGLPRLEDLIGRPIRDHNSLYLRESANPSLEGYSGWFDYSTGIIEIGEQLDPNVTIHELSHGWFNDDTSYHRWITEGLAETYANVVVRHTGGRPRRPEPPARDATGRQPLNAWEDFNFSQQDEDEEAYGYDTSFYVVDALFEEIGPRRMARVLRAIDNGASVYGGDTEPAEPGPVGWRRFLDLVEQVGGSDRATRLFRRYVVSDVDAATLPGRTRARASYAELLEHGAAWEPPAAVRTGMERWEFTGAEELIVAAESTLTQRDSFAATAAAARVNVQLPPGFERGFERADEVADFEAIGADVVSLEDALDVVLAADGAAQGERNPLQVLALGAEDFSSELTAAYDAIGAGDPAEAERLAGRIRSSLAVAESVGRQRANALADAGLNRLWLVPAAAAGALVLAGLLTMLARHRWRRRASSRDVAANLDPGGDAPVDGDVELGVGTRVDLDEDALTRAGFGGVDRSLHVAAGDTGEGSGAARVVERDTGLGDVGNAVLELGEDVGAVVDAQPIARAEVLVDPDTHGDKER